MCSAQLGSCGLVSQAAGAPVIERASRRCFSRCVLDICLKLRQVRAWAAKARRQSPPHVAQQPMQPHEAANSVALCF